MSNNIIGPIGSLIGIGIMAYGAKKIIDVVAEKTSETKTPLKTPLTPTPTLTNKVGFDVDQKLQRMLRRQ